MNKAPRAFRLYALLGLLITIGLVTSPVMAAPLSVDVKTLPSTWVSQADPRAVAMPGEQIEYLVYYTNTGAPVTSASLVDLIPSRSELVLVDVQPVRPYHYDPANRRVEIDLGAMARDAGGVVRIVVEVRPDAVSAMLLHNIAQFILGGVTHEDTSAGTIVQAPVLEASLTGAAEVQRCTDADYTLVVTNTGNLGATNFQLALSLPKGMQYVSTTGPYQPEQRGEFLYWDSQLSLMPNEPRTMTVRTHVPSAGPASMPGTTLACRLDVTTTLPTRVVYTQTAETSATVLPAPCPTYLPSITAYYPFYGDRYEVDDQPELATMVFDDGVGTTHTFHRVGDEDWIRFYAVRGYTYTVETFDLSNPAVLTDTIHPTAWLTRTDTVVSVYDPCILAICPTLTGTLICENDNATKQPYDLSSSCTFKAQLDGWYYVRVRQKDAAVFGQESRYKVRVYHESFWPQ